jgi:hypothetical protein
MNDYLMHHGVKGQKWGVRRYQNADGSLTKEGERHAGTMASKWTLYNKETGAEATRRERNAIAAHMKRNDPKLYKTYKSEARKLDSQRGQRQSGFIYPADYMIGTLLTAAFSQKTPAQVMRDDRANYARGVDKVNGMLAKYANEKMSDFDFDKIRG